MQELIQFKWESHVRVQFLWHLYVEVFMVLLFTVDAILHVNAKVEDIERGNVEAILSAFPILVTLALWTFFAHHLHCPW